MDVTTVANTCQHLDSTLLSRAQRLAGMLHKLHYPEEETAVDLLSDVMQAAPDPAVGLVALLAAALDTRGIALEQRLLGVLPFLDSQLAAAAAPGNTTAPPQQQQQQQQLFTSAELSTALLAAIQLLPDWMEDVPKSPLLLAEVVGHCMAAGQLQFGMRELGAAVKAAGAEQTAEQQGVDDAWLDGPPLIAAGVAAPMLLLVANQIKAVCGEAAAQQAWGSAGVNLAGLLPSSANSPADLQQLLELHAAGYLLS